MDKTVNILVVDDDEVSIELVERALLRSGHSCDVVSAADGLEALEILRGQSSKKIDPPFLILLDLNMPRMNGFEFLDEIRQDSALSRSVVFVLTTSDSPDDIARAYEEHIAGYMTKTAMGPQCAALVRLFETYADSVSLPLN